MKKSKCPLLAQARTGGYPLNEQEIRVRVQPLPKERRCIYEEKLVLQYYVFLGLYLGMRGHGKNSERFIDNSCGGISD